MAFLIKRPEDDMMFAIWDKGSFAEQGWTSNEEEALKFQKERDACTFARHLISRPSVADPLLVKGCDY